MQGSPVGSYLVFGQWNLIRLSSLPFLFAPNFKFSCKVTSIFVLSSFCKCLICKMRNFRGIFYSDLERAWLGMDVSPVSLSSLLWDGCNWGGFSFLTHAIATAPPLVFPLQHGFPLSRLDQSHAISLTAPSPSRSWGVRLHLFFFLKTPMDLFALSYSHSVHVV